MKPTANKFIMAIGGLLVGAVSGFFGGGGGMLLVPLFQACSMPTKNAHATAILVILPVCIVSATVYIINGFFSLRETLAAVIGVVIGAYVGAIALNKLNSTAIAFIFGALMIGVGVKLVIG